MEAHGTSSCVSYSKSMQVCETKIMITSVRDKWESLASP
jgi:hypothetical protein